MALNLANIAHPAHVAIFLRPLFRACRLPEAKAKLDRGTPRPGRPGRCASERPLRSGSDLHPHPAGLANALHAVGGGVENVCASGIHVSAFPEALRGGGQGGNRSRGRRAQVVGAVMQGALHERPPGRSRMGTPRQGACPRAHGQLVGQVCRPPGSGPTVLLLGGQTVSTSRAVRTGWGV